MIPVVAHVGGKREEAAPTGFGDALFHNFAGIRREVAIVDSIFLGYRVADHRNIYSTGARSSREPDAIRQSLIPRNPGEFHPGLKGTNMVGQRFLARLRREIG